MPRRGVVHTLDAFFAAVIIVTTLLYASQVPRERDYEASGNLRARGSEALVRLDGNGTLGRLVEDRNWDEMETLLRLALPSGVSFNLTVLDEGGNAVNDRAVSSGGLVGRTVEAIDYLLAVESGECPLYRVRLQLGGG
jgi:hypothetical protein